MDSKKLLNQVRELVRGSRFPISTRLHPQFDGAVSLADLAFIEYDDDKYVVSTFSGNYVSIDTPMLDYDCRCDKLSNAVQAALSFIISSNISKYLENKAL